MRKFILIMTMALLAAGITGNGAYCGDEQSDVMANTTGVMDNATGVLSNTTSVRQTGDAGKAAVTVKEQIDEEIDIAKNLAGEETVSTYKIKPYRFGNDAYQELTKIWMQAKEALGDSDTARRNELLDELQGRCLDFGITSFEDLSASIIKEGRVQLDVGNKEAAIKLFDAAANISPNYPPAYFAKGWGLFKHNKKKFLVSLDSMIEGFSKSQKNFWWSFYFIGNKVSSVLFTFAALFSLFGLFMAIRYSPLIAHDLAEKFGRKEQEHLFNYLFVPGSFLFILLLLGYWWAVTVIFLLLWVYFNKREKIMSIIFFIMVVFMPTIMSYYASFIQANGNETLWVMTEVDKGIIEKGAEAHISARLQEDPQNTLYMMSLAQIYRKQRKFDNAIEIYEKLISIKPESAVYRNNLGNAYFLSERVDDAVEQYEAAIQYSPKSALPRYNLSQAYAEKLMFTEREQEKNKAAEINPNLIDEVIRRSGDNPYRFIFDENVPTEEFWGIAMTESKESKQIASSVWSTMVRIMPLSGMSFAGIGMIILLFSVNAIRKKGDFSHYCDKCGDVSCRKCQRPHFSKDLCVKCYLTFVKMEGIEAKDRVRKTIEIREKQEHDWLMYRISSLLMPGSGHFLSGRPLRGFVISGLFLFFMKDVFFGSFLEYPYGLSLNVFGPDMVIMIFLMLLVYLFSQLDIYRLTMKKG